MTALALSSPAELSPAQKAWVTRRARDTARASIEVARAGTEQPSPLEGEKIVSLKIDEDAEVGSGSRLYVVVEITDRHAVLFYPPRLITRRVDRLTFDRYAKPSPASSPRKTAKLIRQQMATWRRCFPDDCEMACRRAERALAALNVGTQ